MKLRKNIVRRATRSIFCDIGFRCNVTSRCFGKRVSFSHSKCLFRVPFTVAAKTFWAALEFINAHLPQRDQVASVLRTVDFSLIVCGNTRILTEAAKWAVSMAFLVHIHYPPYFIFSRFCCLGMNSVRETLLINFIDHAHQDYPATLSANDTRFCTPQRHWRLPGPFCVDTRICAETTDFSIYLQSAVYFHARRFACISWLTLVKITQSCTLKSVL